MADQENPDQEFGAADVDLEDDGIIDPSDGLDGDPGQDALDVGYDAPDRPTAAERFGTTATEQRDGESLDQLLAEEEPDIDPYAVAERESLAAENRTDEYVEAGRLVESDEGVREDTEADLIASSADVGLDDLSAEEAAVHIVGED